MPHAVSPARSRWFDRANLILAAAAGVSLIFMVVVISVGVILRFALSMPILGSNEIVQLTSVAVVMLALPWCTALDGHVKVDVLDPFIGKWGRYLGDILSRSLSAFVLAVLVWRSALKALDALKYGDSTNMLNLPIWPFYAMICAGMALCVLVYLMQIALLLTGKAGDHV